VINTTGVNEISEEELLIFPNPANEMIWVKANTGNISMFDAAGKLVYSSVINSEITRVDLNGISSGIYLIEITNENGVVREKFLKR
jgi:hypothetical protein